VKVGEEIVDLSEAMNHKVESKDKPCRNQSLIPLRCIFSIKLHSKAIKIDKKVFKIEPFLSQRLDT
jgi:hypothetical protein